MYKKGGEGGKAHLSILAAESNHTVGSTGMAQEAERGIESNSKGPQFWVAHVE